MPNREVSLKSTPCLKVCSQEKNGNINLEDCHLHEIKQVDHSNIDRHTVKVAMLFMVLSCFQTSLVTP